MSDQKQFSFGKGGDSAEEAAKAMMGGRFARVHFFGIEKPGGQVIVRFITDQPDWLHVKQHAGAPTKNKPEDWPSTSKWPDSMPATCRYDDGFSGYYSDCYICDAKLTNRWGDECRAGLRVWAIAVLREEVIEGGVVKGYRDVMREVPARNEKGEIIEGQMTQERALIVVNQGMKNFFSGLNAMFGVHKTICDRDYVIKKTGESKDTDYQIVGLDPIEIPAGTKDGDGNDLGGRFRGPAWKVVEQNGQKVYERVDEGHPGWKRYLDAIEEQSLDLGAIIADRASDDYYARFFDPDKTPPPRKTDDDKSAGQGAPAEQQQQAPVNDVNPDALAAMRNRVRSGFTGAQGDDASSAEQATPAPASEQPAQQVQSAAATSEPVY